MMNYESTSPSGVSEGHIIPHCEGCKDRGPLTLRVFSNCELTRVIIPNPEIYESRHKTCVTPCRSILKRLIVHFP